MKFKITFEEFINQLNNKFNGAIDSNTYDYDIFKALYDLNDSVNIDIQEFLDSLSFENKTGDTLDSFLSFFNFDRIKGNNSDIYELEVLLNSTNSLIIKKDSIISFNQNNYKVIKDAIIDSINTTVIDLQKTFSSYEFINPVFSAGGIAIFEKNNIELFDTQENISEILPKYLKILSIKNITSDVESDLEFSERSKSVMQSLGFSNNKKIEIELLKDSRIRSLQFKNKSGVTEITIFPKILNEIDSIISYSQGVIDYYKTSNILLLKPNVDEINITGISSQISSISENNKILSEILTSIKEYLSNTLIDNRIVKSDIINLISSIVNSYSITSFDYDKVKIYNYFYFRNNYEYHLISTEITYYMDIGNNVLTISELG